LFFNEFLKNSHFYTNFFPSPNGFMKSPFSYTNIKCFLAFRVLFNARFYYPVFTILFLDMGLTLEQFALLNAAWAATIVLSEVPSGALADRWGRKRMVQLAATLMVLEMALLCLTPQGSSSYLFWIVLLNRMLSGVAEAAASGADEALAYDTLVDNKQKDQWPRVLTALMRLQSLGFVIAMSLGAAIYDPDLVQSVAHWLGWTREWSQSDTLKWPLYLNLGTALIAFLIVKKMKDPPLHTQVGLESSSTGAWKETVKAGFWVLRTPIPFLLLLAGLFYDSITRLFATLTSEYYRLIDIPEGYYGLIGSGVAFLGLILPWLARVMVEKFTMRTNAVLLALWIAFSLYGLSLLLPLTGLVFAVGTLVSMQFTGFFVSHYLNQVVDSKHRATVLSFRGLANNLAYGALSLVYAGLINWMRTQGASGDEAFAWALYWFAPYFLFSFFILFCAALVRAKR